MEKLPLRGMENFAGSLREHMGDFNILYAADTAQYNTWLEAWLSWDSREVFAHPEYVKLFVRERDCAICAVQKSPAGLIMLPLILRPLSVEAWAGEDNTYYDIVTPYGFGGPYITGNCDITAFWREFNQWAVETGVLSSFFRLSPFAADINNCVTDIESTGDIVIRSLSEGKEAIWQDYDRKVRSNVNRALQNELRVEIDERGTGLADFVSIYYRTMQRRDAMEMYYFQEDFFHRMVENLAGQFVFFHVFHQERVISSLLVLLSQDHTYAYLLGTDSEALKLNPNEILHHTAITWSIDQGKKSYVLGGGYERGDGILRFKKYFAPNGVIPFVVGKHIFDPKEYQSMCEKREKYEAENGGVWSSTGYFPAYRAKSD